MYVGYLFSGSLATDGKITEENQWNVVRNLNPGMDAAVTVRTQVLHTIQYPTYIEMTIHALSGRGNSHFRVDRKCSS